MPDRVEWQQLAEFAEHAAALTAPERIRTIGTRRIRRRRAGQAVLGTGALAVAAFFATGLATGGSGGGHGTAGIGAASASVRASATGTATADATATARYTLPTIVSSSHASSLEAVLQQKGFAYVTVTSVSSSTVPAGNVIDIDDAHGHSMLGHTVSTTEPLSVVVSAGPSH